MAVHDGSSAFTNHAYVGHAAVEAAVSALDSFKDEVNGGRLELGFGAFGPGYASGAFLARFELVAPGRLYVSTEQESEFVELAGRQVASRATLHLRSEPALLDRFIAELRALSTGKAEEAYLEAV
jgi:hypothetical protein